VLRFFDFCSNWCTLWIIHSKLIRSTRTLILRLLIRLKYASKYLHKHHTQGTRILIWFTFTGLSFLMWPFMVSWQILQHIKNVVHKILFSYRQICKNQISVSFTWPIMSLLRFLPLLQTCCGEFWKMFTESLVPLQITMLWYYYTYHHELCSVQSVRPVLVNSKAVFTNSLARFEILTVVMLKIGEIWMWWCITGWVVPNKWNDHIAYKMLETAWPNNTKEHPRRH
jgi:hypothetical protein